MNLLNKFLCTEQFSIHVLGGASDAPMPYPYVLNKLGITDVATIDVRQDSQAQIKADYLNLQISENPDFIITNPPFSKAIEFVKKALEDVKDDGWVF